MSVQNEINRITQNVANTYAVLSALGADMPDEQTSDNLATTAGSAKAVLYAEQTLTDEEMAQARANIGAISASEVKITLDVSHDGNGNVTILSALDAVSDGQGNVTIGG